MAEDPEPERNGNDDDITAGLLDDRGAVCTLWGAARETATVEPTVPNDGGSSRVRAEQPSVVWATGKVSTSGVVLPGE
eukprot:COSAG06_NODE_3331_length_5493_cov_4.197220_5_plen_78_part_00